MVQALLATQYPRRTSQLQQAPAAAPARQTSCIASVTIAQQSEQQTQTPGLVPPAVQTVLSATLNVPKLMLLQGLFVTPALMC